MDSFENKYSFVYNGNAIEDNIVFFKNFRITVITPFLIRIEESKTKDFCDLPTQTVLCRNFGKVNYFTDISLNSLIIKTDECQFCIGSKGLMKVIFPDGFIVTDFKKGNLKGTRRTLDVTFGKVHLQNGILSKNGVAIMDDTKSLLLLDNQILKQRNAEEKDYYVFAYGNKYLDALKDFYRLTGSTPLIPRYCLGNWWSRYWAYTQSEYLELMDKFEKEHIPLTVACIDMDWHWTDVAKRFGEKANDYSKPKSLLAKITGSFLNPGWTGYSWNRDLFPNHVDFLNKLHEKGLKVNLNVHPAQGIRFFEDMYPEIASYMNIDIDSKETVEFDFTNRKFVEGYFKYINDPMEKEGVDFWWIDWQQGNKSKVPGLDPLWLLNHFYCLDRKKKGLRPLTLSRFAGFGSHRYPLGFSGDAAVKWSVLAFQPYFTVTAANAGYTWWSHDIGGHNFGRRDDELYLRWLQFGVFSPIMRFHSVNDAFMGKEPWKFSGSVKNTAVEFLRLRHRMIPYTYTINRLTETEGIPLLIPMYYFYPREDNAYRVENEYFFGTQMIVAPITEKVSKTTNMASVEVWLPEGRYTDIFTGRIYKGGKKFHMCRDITLIPVLAKSGTIIPLDGRKDGNNCENPNSIELLIYRGDGSFTLYEDDGETLNYKDGYFAETMFNVKENGSDLIFKINPVVGDLNLIPKERKFVLKFCDVEAAEVIMAFDGESKCDFIRDHKDGFLSVTVDKVIAEIGATITLSGIKKRKNPDKKELITEALSKVQGEIFMKSMKYKKCLADDFNGQILAPASVRHMLEEIMNMDFSI